MSKREQAQVIQERERKIQFGLEVLKFKGFPVVRVEDGIACVDLDQWFNSRVDHGLRLVPA